MYMHQWSTRMYARISALARSLSLSLSLQGIFFSQTMAKVGASIDSNRQHKWDNEMAHEDASFRLHPPSPHIPPTSASFLSPASSLSPSSSSPSSSSSIRIPQASPYLKVTTYTHTSTHTHTHGTPITSAASAKIVEHRGVGGLRGSQGGWDALGLSASHFF